MALSAACTNHDQVTPPVCIVLDASPAQPCSSIGETCVNPGDDPPQCTCTKSGWLCPVHHDARAGDAESEADDGPLLILNLGDAQMTDDVAEDVTQYDAGGDVE